MDYISELTEIAGENGGLIETKTAAEHGISRAMLSKLYQQKRLQRIAYGQYILPDEMEDELYAIGRRAGRLIFSHETALYLHGISDRTPFEHTVTVPAGSMPSPSMRRQCRVYYIKPELFDLGKTTMMTPYGNAVACYDLERTICDIVRSRNKVGTETFLSALRLYADSPRKDLNRLYAYAKQLRVTKTMRQYLEVLL